MNYGFAPGGTKFDLDVAKYLRLRPDSTVLQPPTNDVAAFIAMVNTSASVQRPVGQLAIGCHGHPYGILQIPLDSSSGKQSDINDVTRVETSHALAIPTASLFPRPLDPTTHIPLIPVFRIVGCSIGAARPFLQHLLAALSPTIVVVATKHEDGELAMKVATGGVTVEGVLRTLTYDFRVNAATALEGPADVVQAFDDQHLSFVDGKKIPTEFWKKRVPNDILATTATTTSLFNVVFNPKINGAATLPLALDRWEHIWEPVGPWNVTAPAHNLPSTSERREFMRAQIKSRPEFAAGHPFPVHQQRGFATYDAFIDGYDWLPSRSSDAVWSGYRNVYRVGAAITIPSDGDEIPYDWVDTTNTATHLGLDESDATLFVRVL
jgi:hypothetical protein